MTTKQILNTAILAAKEDGRHEGRIATIRATLQTAHFGSYTEYKEFRTEWIALYLSTKELPADSNAGAVAFGVYGGTDLNPNRQKPTEEPAEESDKAAAEPETVDTSAEALAKAYADKNWRLCRAIVRAAEALAKVKA
jgi:hypothetical protein